MSNSARESIYEAIACIRLIDPHTHINPHSPASNTLADLLGYHYYTELAHSAGMPKSEIEEEGVLPRELVHRLVSNLSPIENTVQYRWLVELCRMFFGFDDERIDLSNWEQVYDSAERQMQLAEWPQMVLDQSNVEAVFLTNDFDDELSGFDTETYIPCLRTDDLVFHLAKLETRQRLAACSGIELDGSLVSLRESLKQRFEHFVGRGARACAISLPPTFQPTPVSDGRAATALDEVLVKGPLADPSHQKALSRRVFWTLAELCDHYHLPFDLMIGVNRGVYENGVYQGQDLYDSRVSLIQYRELFNSFPEVKFPISVLASVTNQELVSYAWIFPNVITNGHWWYSNTPSFIARDAAARLEAVPQTKQIAYYSDAYKLEFVWPKFDMYRRVLSGILADHFVDGFNWSEERAVELGRQVLRDNVDEIFPRPQKPESTVGDWDEEAGSEDQPEVISLTTEQDDWVDPAAAGSSAALAAGAIGMVEVSDSEDEVSDSAESVTESTDAPSVDVDESFSSVIEPELSATGDLDESPEEESLDLAEQSDLGDESSSFGSPSISEETDEFTEPIAMDESEDDIDSSEFPTVVEMVDTVRIDEMQGDEFVESTSPDTEAVNDSGETAENVVDSWEASEAPAELDPLPTDDEIQAVDVNDVELTAFDAGTAAPDADAIEAEAEPEPIDVGDLLGDNDPEESSSPEIHMFRGEGSFEPDEESLQLKADPATGELTFPVPGSEDDNADIVMEPASEVDESAESVDDAEVLSTFNDDWLSEDPEPAEAEASPQSELPRADAGDEALDGGDLAIEPDERLDPIEVGPVDHAEADHAEADEELDLEATLDFEEIGDAESPDDPDESDELYL